MRRNARARLNRLEVRLGGTKEEVCACRPYVVAVEGEAVTAACQDCGKPHACILHVVYDSEGVFYGA